MPTLAAMDGGCNCRASRPVRKETARKLGPANGLPSSVGIGAVRLGLLDVVFGQHAPGGEVAFVPQGREPSMWHEPTPMAYGRAGVRL